MNFTGRQKTNLRPDLRIFRALEHGWTATIYLSHRPTGLKSWGPFIILTELGSSPRNICPSKNMPAKFAKHLRYEHTHTHTHGYVCIYVHRRSTLTYYITR